MTREFADQRLHWADMPSCPFDLFEAWYREARESEPWHGAAMTLSTIGDDDTPSARIVLLRGLVDGAFRFYTNYESRKGRHLGARAGCSLVFWWSANVRQVRVEGRATKLPEAVSDAYFAARPRGSRIGAWASSQSSVIDSRAELEAAVASVDARFEGQDVPRPPHWGGYGVVPHRIEFWQGGQARLHDRFCYVRNLQKPDEWTLERLSP